MNSSLLTLGRKASHPSVTKRVSTTPGLLLIAWIVLANAAATARGQSALDGFDPNVNGAFNVAVSVAVVQTDGKILIGGAFSTVSPNGGGTVTRNNLARLNPDGTLDTGFNPNANGVVSAIAIQSDGKVLVAGDFTNIGGQPRNGMARLDATTGLADSFDPNPGHGVYALVVQADDKILVGGFFTNIGGQERNNIARLDATTGLADSFDPDASSTVTKIVLQRDGRILVAGSFSAVGGQKRASFARLDATTGLADSFNPDADGQVLAMAEQADGKILIGGIFGNIGGQARQFFARLDPSTGLADSFDPNPDADNPFVKGISRIAVQPDGKIIAGGSFNNIGGQMRYHLARLDPATGLADSFDPAPHGQMFQEYVGAIVIQADGKILLGGGFTTLSPNGGAAVTRNHIARVEANGLLDRTLNLNTIGDQVEAIAVQSDGKILIGGNFTSVLGVGRNNIARLNTDGTLDAEFNPNADSSVICIVVQPDGKILVGGAFSNIGGQGRGRIARLDPTTGLADSLSPNPSSLVYTIAVQSDGKILVGGLFNFLGGQEHNFIGRIDGSTGQVDSFNPNANGFVEAITIQPDGKILVGGGFTGPNSIGGQTRRAIARLDPTTGLADSFNPNANGAVYTIVLQSDGKILAGGSFSGANSIGGQGRNRLARLDPATGLADSFNPNANDFITSIAVQADGKIVVGGNFSGANSIGGQTRNRIARIDAVTGLADTFNPNANNSVYAVTILGDGKIMAGGLFGSCGGQTRTFLARLSNDTAALQNLRAMQTSVTWTRAGSSPLLFRASFESSIDGVNYNPLGSGSGSGSNWTLTGLNLPFAQNFYVRARGHYRSGSENGSENIVESVRNVFLAAAPLQITTAVSRKTHGGAGDFDVPLPLGGEFGVECRSSGGAHTLVFTFSNNVVSGNASVTAGSGSVSGSPAFFGNTMTVNLTGVSDVQQITVTLSGVTDSNAQVLPDTAVSMNVLAGDTNGNKTVSATDVAQTKSQSGLAVTSANFRNDVAVNGTINATDVGLVKSRSGQSLP